MNPTIAKLSDPTIAKPFKSRATFTPKPSVATIDAGVAGCKPDHRPDEPIAHAETASPLAMRMAEMAMREMRGYAHSGWCAVHACTCRTTWLAARFDELMK